MSGPIIRDMVARSARAVLTGLATWVVATWSEPVALGLIGFALVSEVMSIGRLLELHGREESRWRTQ